MNSDPDNLMLDLFRAEVESHSEALSNALLKLEKDHEAVGLLDVMMRAAHSIKGAARIVRVEAAADVAHVMEDCFVAAQRGELTLKSGEIDVMLRAVDLLVRISDASKDPAMNWSNLEGTIRATVDELQCVLTHKPLPHFVHAKIESLSPETIPVDDRSTDTRIAILDDPRPTSAQVLVLPATFDVAAAESMRLLLLENLENFAVASIDLSALRDLDALGLAWIHSASRHAASLSKALRIVNVPDELQEALVMVGLVTSKDVLDD